jgi:hypothetical protein
LRCPLDILERRFIALPYAREWHRSRSKGESGQ